MRYAMEIKSNECKCGGYRFFWACEISGWKGKPSERVICLDCGRPFWFERVWYWWNGYTSNKQITTDKLQTTNANLPKGTL